MTEGADQVCGFAGNDILYGLGGNDWIQGGAGADNMDGGAGIDTVFYYNDFAQTGVHVSLATGLGHGGNAKGDVLINIENLRGTEYDDELEGDAGSNELVGWDDHDTLKGGGGADFLAGGLGDDLLKGGGGAGHIEGGGGNDVVSYASSPSGVSVLLSNRLGFGGDAEGDTFLGPQCHRVELWRYAGRRRME